MLSKAKAQQAHGRRRSIERYGVGLTKIAEREIIEKIQNGKATFLEKESNRISLFGVKYAGEETVVVYDKTRGTIVTLMPRESTKWKDF